MEKVCDICANPFEWFAFGQCDHTICHLCCLRLRALYKTVACPICKTECLKVIFSSSQEKSFHQYQLQALKQDKKLSIYFEKIEIYNQTMDLLLFNCPSSGCNVVCNGGWQELKNHVKKAHSSVLCDVCVSFKKVFVHESTLYTQDSLKVHYKSGDNTDSSFKGHPECGFCSIKFYDSDALYEHCREKHEKCFLCDRQGIRDQYFHNYMSLEKHFHSEHFPCFESECLEQKFVVFASDLDLQGHFLEKHADVKTKSKGRQIKIEFTYAGGPMSSKRGARSQNASNNVDDVYETNESTPDFTSSRRLRAPEGFGSHLSHPVSQTGGFQSFSPRPQVGASLANSSTSNSFPLPQESQSYNDELLLTPAQNDIFLLGGPEIIFAIQKMIGLHVSAMSRLKLAFWSYRNGSLPAEKLLPDFVSMVESNHPRKRPEQLLGEMSSLWHRLADTMPEEATNIQIQKALEKKSKKKGLTIEEFEALRKGEPKRTAMLRVWNDRKVKIQQATSEIMPRKQNSWAAIDPIPSSSTKKPPQSNSARVLVIKDRGSALQRKEKKISQSAAFTSAPLIESLSLSSSASSLSQVIEQPTPKLASVASVVTLSKAGPSISKSQAEFPALPPPAPKQSFRNGRRMDHSGASAWGSSSFADEAQDSFSSFQESATSSGKKQGKKKGKKVLIKFG